MLASANETLGIVLTFAFVFCAIGVVLYALVRPFTHLHHQPGSGVWTHLP